jgi:hypothetical protein
MNAQFENVLNGGAGALCELETGDLTQVNGGSVIPMPHRFPFPFPLPFPIPFPFPLPL